MLTGAIAHELSQPLAAILLSARAARRLFEQDPMDTAEICEALEDIVRNDQRAGAVIDRLRSLLKKGPIVRQPLDLNDVAREELDLARSDFLARRIVVTARLAPGIPPVLGDRIQLQQVILNIVLNASDAMVGREAGERRLTLETGIDGDFVELSISDSGIGIPEDHLDTIFEPFVTFREHGLGLGLAISRSILVSHGGRIVSENNRDRGATFRCYFPIASVPMA